MSTPNMVNENLGNEVRQGLDEMIDKLSQMPIGLPLVWLYIWDVIKSQYQSYSADAFDFYVINSEYTIDDVWNKLWAEPQFSLEYGLEALDDHIADWLVSNKFIIETEPDE